MSWLFLHFELKSGTLADLKWVSGLVNELFVSKYPIKKINK